MIELRRLVFVLSFVLVAAGSAQAFQESAPASEATADAIQTPAEDDTALGLGPDEGSSEDQGIVPNLDFGLELLYGGKSSVPTETGPADDSTGLKGRLKHTF